MTIESFAGWYGANAGSFARLQGLGTERKDVGDFVTLGQQVEVK
jgi:hypothetical protein